MLSVMLVAGAVASPLVHEVEVSHASAPPAVSCAEAKAALRTAGPSEAVQPDPPKPKPKPSPTPKSSRRPRLSLAAADLPAVAFVGPAPNWPPIPIESVDPQPIEGTPDALSALRDIVSRAERDEPIRISIYGDSHTAADFWSGQFRSALQTSYGDGGHGFVFPAAVFRWYRGADITLCDSGTWTTNHLGKRGAPTDLRMGVSGMYIESGDADAFAWVETKPTRGNGAEVSGYEVYTMVQPGGGTLAVSLDGRVVADVDTAGEQIRLQVHRFTVPLGPHRLQVQPRGDGPVRLLGLSTQRDPRGVVVDAMGVNGRVARDLLRFEDPLFGEGLGHLRPDLVVLQYGVNEANDTALSMDRYKQTVTKSIERVREHAPNAACLLLGPTDRVVHKGELSFSVWERERQVAVAQREVAVENNCSFWDWQQAMGGEGSILAWYVHEPALASRDLIHLTAAGYSRSANLLLDAIRTIAVE